MAKNTRTRGVCSIKDCGRPHCAKSYCKIHYYRLRRTGHLERTQMHLVGRRCEVDGCENGAKAKGKCIMHYDRLRRHGEVGPANPHRRRRAIGDKRVNRDGYVLVYRPDYPGIKRPHYMQEHRLALEAKLGRPLESFETAHHLNGIRHDNRPENLELWTHPQPTGQRPEDLVDWVLEHYADIVAQRMQSPVPGYFVTDPEEGL